MSSPPISTSSTTASCEHQFLGPYSNSLHLTSENWLDKLGTLQSKHVTNGLMFELSQQLQKEGNRSESFSHITSSLETIYKEDLSWLDHSKLKWSFSSLKQQRSKLLKNKSKQSGLNHLEVFLNELYILPKQRKRQRDEQEAADSPHRKKVKCACEETERISKLTKDLCSAHAVIEEKNKLIKELKDELNVKESQLNDCRAKLKKIHSVTGKVGKPKHVIQTLKRKERSVLLWKKKYSKLRKEVQMGKVSRRLKEQKQKLKSVRKEKLRLLRRQKSQTSGSVQQGMQCHHGNLNVSLNNANEHVKYLENKYLEQLDHEDDMIRTKDGKSYCSSIREASYYLQDLGLSEKQTSNAMKAVVETVTGKKLIGPLPSVSTQNRFSSEMKSISDKQIEDKLAGHSNLTLKYDGTTKSKGHLTEVEISSADDTFLCGVRQQVGGKADDYVETILDVCGEPILSRVKNTMTDRCVTNDSVDKKLAETLGNRELNSFRCSMHPLDSFYHACENSIRAQEKIQEDVQEHSSKQMPYKNGSESCTQALLRAVDKLFHDLGCGCGRELREFLHSKGYTNSTEIHDKTEVYFRWVGNRFNIFFLDAMLVFSYSDAIQEFFQKVHHPSNNLQVAVLNAIKEGKCNTYLRALGLVGKYITGPWMRLVSQDLNILSMNPFFSEAASKLSKWTQNPSDMLSSQCSIFDSVPLKEDKHLSNLLKFTSQDDKDATESVLGKLLTAVESVILRQLKTQLPGGEFWNPSPRLEEEAKSVSAHNISGERRFAVVDAYIKRAPNASIGTIEAKTMFRCNKTRTWLTTQNKQKKMKLITQAISQGRKLTAANRAREIRRRQRLKERLVAMRKELSEREERQRLRQERLIEQVMETGGLWTTKEDMQTTTKHMGKGKITASIKAQINVRIKVLGLPCKKIVFGKSTLEQLKEQLLHLMAQPIQEEKLEVYKLLMCPDDLIGRRFTQKWLDNKGDEIWWTGTVAGKTDGEFRVEYENDNKTYFLTPEELLSDVVVGEMDLLPYN